MMSPSPGGRPETVPPRDVHQDDARDDEDRYGARFGKMDGEDEPEEQELVNHDHRDDDYVVAPCEKRVETLQGQTSLIICIEQSTDTTAWKNEMYIVHPTLSPANRSTLVSPGGVGDSIVITANPSPKIP